MIVPIPLPFIKPETLIKSIVLTLTIAIGFGSVLSAQNDNIEALEAYLELANQYVQVNYDIVKTVYQPDSDLSEKQLEKPIKSLRKIESKLLKAKGIEGSTDIKESLLAGINNILISYQNEVVPNQHLIPVMAQSYDATKQYIAIVQKMNETNYANLTTLINLFRQSAMEDKIDLDLSLLTSNTQKIDAVNYYLGMYQALVVMGILAEDMPLALTDNSNGKAFLAENTSTLNQLKSSIEGRGGYDGNSKLQESVLKQVNYESQFLENEFPKMGEITSKIEPTEEDMNTFNTIYEGFQSQFFSNTKNIQTQLSKFRKSL